MTFSSSLGLLALPSLAPEVMLYLAATVALACVAVGGRATLAWLAMRDQWRAIDRLSVRIEQGQPDLAARFADSRSRLTEAHAAVERQMWALPRADRLLALAVARLSALRAEVEEWRGPGGTGLSGTFAGLRRTLGMLNTADRFRRVIQR